MVMVVKKFPLLHIGMGRTQILEELTVKERYIDKGEVVEHDTLGVVGTAGIGYRRLSTHMSMPTSLPMYSMTMLLRINFLVLVQD